MLSLKQACIAIANFYKRDFSINIDFGAFPTNGSVVRFTYLQFKEQQLLAQGQIAFGNNIQLSQELDKSSLEFWITNLTFDTKLVSVQTSWDESPRTSVPTTAPTTVSTTVPTTTVPDITEKSPESKEIV